MKLLVSRSPRGVCCRGPEEELCTRAKSEQVAVKMPDMALEFEIPVEIQRALGVA